MAWTGSYEELEAYLRGFVNFSGDPAPYDHVGVITLWSALLDNLREYASEEELEDLGEGLTDEQADFLLRLAESVRRAKAD